MRTFARLLAIALGAASAQPAFGAEGAVHGLFVGVADYRFGTAEGALRDLEGAPQDVAAIRQALAARQPLASSTVLLDAQATRAAVLAALDRFAGGQAGMPGETLVFYYTGHGAQAVDMGGAQASGFHSTLVPWDARDPEKMRRDETGDILDVELRERIDAITARGINVVSIFDSCNSGTATRSVGGRSKSAPAAAVPASAKGKAPAVRQPASTGAGYRVHLAAAVDNSEAFENQGDDGKWRSDYTAALAREIAAKPKGVSYREIFDAASQALASQGKGQQPRAEGALLTPFLASHVVTDRLFSVSVGTGGTLSLAGGRLALVTPGARMAVYASPGSAALPGEVPLGIGKVVSAGADSAQLDLVLPEARGELVARELSPGEGAAPLTLAGGAADHALAGAARGWRKAAGAGDYRLEPRAGMVEISRRDGGAIATVAPGAELAVTLDRIARHDALAALSGKSDGLDVPFAFAASDCNGANPIDFSQAGDRATIAVGSPVRVSLTNPLADTPLYFYLLYLGSDFSISLLEPAPFSQPAAWPGGACASRKITPDAAGRQRLLLVASTTPLPGLSTLDQPGIAGLVTSPTAADRASGTRGEVRWAVQALDIDVR